MSFFSKIILFLKGAFSIFQVILGGIGIFFGYQKVQDFIHFLAGIELKEDSTDFIALKVIQLSESISVQSGIIFMIYIIIEGLVKLLLIYGVYKDRKGVFPIAFFIFGMLLLYQIYLIFHGHNLLIIGLIILDTLLIGIMYKEYKKIT